MRRRDLLKAAVGIPAAANAKVLPGRWIRHTIKTDFKPMDPWALVEMVDFGDFPPAIKAQRLSEAIRRLR